MLPSDPDKAVGYLYQELVRDEPRLKLNDLYYEGQQPLQFMAPMLQDELGDRITELVLNWPRLGTRSYLYRLRLIGFRYARPRRAPVGPVTSVPDDDLDDEIWGGWIDNGLVAGSRQGIIEGLINGRWYTIIGGRGDDEDSDGEGLPLITVEHPTQVYSEADPRTRQTAAAVKRWIDDYETQAATLYLPDETRHYRMTSGEWRELPEERDEHGFGVVPVVKWPNEDRLLRPGGTSEFRDVIPLADAANKMATDMMISGEFHAMPRRWVFGMKEDDFVNEVGEALSTWQSIAGRLWATDKKPDEVAAGQFPEADLSNFHNTIKLLAQLAGQMLDLPPHYMSFNTDNPASADGIRASDSRMVARAEDKQVALGEAAKLTMRIWHRSLTGIWDARLRRLEPVWRDPATPTVAQAADAAVKLYQAGIVPLRQTRIKLGFQPAEIDQMEAEDAKAAAADPLADIARQQAGSGADQPDLDGPGTDDEEDDDSGGQA
ncbi:phage portal protein [Dactylosporangium sp. NPDC005572]|uniref:phage portal protein n=1 Tax=Dactylosporangium sp. NPDC005572 TaxID=3156889 RepID=UPI0033AB43AC